MKIISTLLLVAFMAMSWSYGEAQNCKNCMGSTGKVICGLNMVTGEMVTFQNKCWMDRYTCLVGMEHRHLDDGLCPVTKSMSYGETETLDQAKACSTCSRNFKPLCGHDEKGNKKTFSSACALNRHNCLTGDDYKILKKGSCYSGESNKNLLVKLN
ncbi:uncharacterized protein LOC108732259 [Agrilus planipennis]|uniref:Uncharacterized protein LOC108732259 n=1 Tax=Agrilus planipennis TaxID=224129 RepID=A0A1W4WEB5_AGRPL|nr:uncharacterized protein LOC108732259 [Agrilus planipennis]